jgi:hypothetical protein
MKKLRLPAQGRRSFIGPPKVARLASHSLHRNGPCTVQHRTDSSCKQRYQLLPANFPIPTCIVDSIRV